MASSRQWFKQFLEFLLQGYYLIGQFQLRSSGLLGRLASMRRIRLTGQLLGALPQLRLLGLDHLQQRQQVSFLSLPVTVSFGPDLLHVFDPQSDNLQIVPRRRVIRIDLQAVSPMSNCRGQQSQTVLTHLRGSFLRVIAKNCFPLSCLYAPQIVTAVGNQFGFSRHGRVAKQFSRPIGITRSGENTRPVVPDARILRRRHVRFGKCPFGGLHFAGTKVADSLSYMLGSLLVRGFHRWRGA